MAATGQRLTWAGLAPEEHAERVASRARKNAAKIPEEFRGGEQRYRLRVVDDDVDSEGLYAYEGSRFNDPARAVELVREGYPGQYAHGLYDLDPVYVRYPGDREQTVPFGEPLGGDDPEHEEEPPPDGLDDDPLDDGTLGYDYHGPSWLLRDIQG